MSKKSTSRTGNDGNTDAGSENGSSCSNESKCNLPQNLSHKEERTAELNGDYFSSTHQLLTPNSKEPQRNHVTETLANTHKSNSASCSSLDDELYGTSDAFNKNLEYLKKRLVSLRLAESNTSHKVISDSDTRSSNSGSSPDSNIISEGYLSTRETFINISSPFESYRLCERFKNYSCKYLESNRSVISTIYEAPEIYESDNTASSTSYRVPEKRRCLRNSECSENSSHTPLTSSPKNVNISQLLLNLPTEESVSPYNSFKGSGNSSKKTCQFSPAEKPQIDQSVKLFLPLDIHSRTSSEAAAPSSGRPSSINYQVPIKRKCIRNKTPILSSTSNIPEVTKTVESVEKVDVIPVSFSRTVCTQCADTEFCSNENEIQENTDQNQEDYLTHIKPPSEGEDNSARTVGTPWNESNKETNNYFSVHNTPAEGINLPSTVIEDSASSSKTSTIEPNIRIIDTKSKKIDKRRRNNRIEPIAEIKSSKTSTTTIAGRKSSGNSCKDHKSSHSKNTVRLHKKYLEDTSEISSNVNSTPPYVVSSNASDTSRYSSGTTETNRGFNKDLQKSKPSSKGDSLPDFDKYYDLVYIKSRTFDPLLCTSLDIPKIKIYSYIFPAFSQITTVAESFVCQLNLADCCDINDKLRRSESLYTKNSQCYKDEAEVLLNSPSISPERKKLKIKKIKEIIDDTATVTNKPSNNIESESNSPRKKLFQRHLAFRKKQSTDMSFYSVPTDIALDEEFAVVNTESSASDVSIRTVEARTSCCCFNIFFAKRKREFFK